MADKVKKVEVRKKVVTTIAVDDSPTEDKNTVLAAASKPKVKSEGRWIKATIEEVKQYEKDRRLVGYDPENQEVIILAEEKAVEIIKKKAAREKQVKLES